MIGTERRWERWTLFFAAAWLSSLVFMLATAVRWDTPLKRANPASVEVWSSIFMASAAVIPTLLPPLFLRDGVLRGCGSTWCTRTFLAALVGAGLSMLFDLEGVPWLLPTIVLAAIAQFVILNRVARGAWRWLLAELGGRIAMIAPVLLLPLQSSEFGFEFVGPLACAPLLSFFLTDRVLPHLEAREQAHRVESASMPARQVQ